MICSTNFGVPLEDLFMAHLRRGARFDVSQRESSGSCWARIPMSENLKGKSFFLTNQAIHAVTRPAQKILHCSINHHYALSCMFYAWLCQNPITISQDSWDKKNCHFGIIQYQSSSFHSSLQSWQRGKQAHGGTDVWSCWTWKQNVRRLRPRSPSSPTLPTHFR